MNTLYAVATKWVTIALVPAAVPVSAATYVALRPVQVDPVAVAMALPIAPARHAAPKPAAVVVEEVAEQVLTMPTLTVSASVARAAKPVLPERQWVCTRDALLAGRLGPWAVRSTTDLGVAKCEWQ